MDGLRWLLLAVGIVVIVGVYFYSRRQTEPAAKAGDALADGRIEPSLGAVDDSALPDAPDVPDTDEEPVPTISDVPTPEFEPVADVEPALSEEPPAIQPEKQKIVTLRVVARDRGAFRGDELILSLRGIGMRHGKFGIFHRFDGDADDRAIFSAASLVEPGSFDLPNIKDQSIPGISLFAVLPGPVAAVEAFDLMMAAARAIAKTMEADLLDESGSTLSIQRERYLREEVIAFEHARQIAG